MSVISHHSLGTEVDTWRNVQTWLNFDILIFLSTRVKSLIMLDECNVQKQDRFENSNEYLPLTAPGYYYIVCRTEGAM